MFWTNRNWRTLQVGQVMSGHKLIAVLNSMKNAYHWYFSSMPNLRGGETREQVLNSPLVSSNLMFAYLWSLLWSTSALSSLSVPPTTSPTRGTSRSTAETLYVQGGGGMVVVMWHRMLRQGREPNIIASSWLCWCLRPYLYICCSYTCAFISSSSAECVLA